MASRALILLVLALAVSPALAQTPKSGEPAKKEQPAAKKEKAAEPAAAPGNPVIARVNGTPIFRSDLEALRASLPPQAQQAPMEQLYPRLMDQLVASELVSQAALKQKLNDDPRVKTMEALAAKQILWQAYFDSTLRADITEAKLKEKYDEYLKNNPSQEEVHARHILVPTEAEAKEVIEELKKGADFAKLASEKTTDPAGKASGGDLGYFREGDMVPDFAKAAFALKPGEFSQTPAHTQFGWHVIKVEDRRQGKPPTYQEIAPRIGQEMQQQIYQDRVKQLASVAKIEVFNPDGSKPEPPPAAAAAPNPAPTPAAASPVAQQPPILPLDNGNPGAPPPAAGPPTMAPATQGIGK